MTRRDTWAKRPATTRYWAFKDRVKELGITLPVKGAHVTFHIPIPASWSKAKKGRMSGKPHTQQGDVDNYLKALMDAIYTQDGGIWDVRITKLWANEGGITIV
jgi:Holliday junction resolvase RusA-like endonuclease